MSNGAGIFNADNIAQIELRREWLNCTAAPWGWLTRRGAARSWQPIGWPARRWNAKHDYLPE
jgi:hypothetical protein